MATPAQIKQAIRDIVKAQLTAPITGVVQAVDGDVCNIKLKSGLTVSNIKLKATAGGTDYLVLQPKVGTTVTCLSLSGDVNNMVVVKADQVEQMKYKQNGLEVVVDSTDGKVSVKNENASLFDILTDLSTLLKQLKVFTPVGPSGTPLPDSILAIEAFETKFNEILK